jgi:hypothetical protein
MSLLGVTVGVGYPGLTTRLPAVAWCYPGVVGVILVSFVSLLCSRNKQIFLSHTDLIQTRRVIYREKKNRGLCIKTQEYSPLDAYTSPNSRSSHRSAVFSAPPNRNLVTCVHIRAQAPNLNPTSVVDDARYIHDNLPHQILLSYLLINRQLQMRSTITSTLLYSAYR